MFDELSEYFDKVLICGNSGVLVAVAKACLRLQCKQVKFIQVRFIQLIVMQYIFNRTSIIII